MTPGLIVATVLLTGNVQASTAAPAERPRAAVVIVIDQMRADYITRFTPYFTGGLKRLITEGAVFDSASHEHANTETAVGHATLSTGCFPAHHGIVGNDFYDRPHERIVYSVEDTATRLLRTTTATLKRDDSLGASAHYLLRPSIANWVKQADSNNRVFSVSLKDRPAVLMAGQPDRYGTRADGVYWWDRKTGDFVTSTAYAESLPGWVNQFNQSGFKNWWNDSVWNRFGDSSQYILIGADSIALENDGIHTAFPHSFMTERAGRKGYDALFYTPYADQLLIEFARELVRQVKPGTGKGFDLLMISCSAADAVGHSYGPNSQELLDHYLRLDRCLDTLLNTLDSSIGRDHYVVALSSDHGCAELPVAANRVSRKAADSVIFAAVKSISGYVPALDSLVILNGDEIDFIRRPPIPDSLLGAMQTAIADRLRNTPWVEAVFSRAEIMAAGLSASQLAHLAHDCYAQPDRAPDLLVISKPQVYVTNATTGTSHGTPHWYDRHVPLIFWGIGIPTKHIAQRVRTVDMAPTLVELIGLNPPDSADGESLTPQLQN
jgi:predicted AlkP superfamily pyrophosphatase or phosphodiesterase